MGTPSRVEVVEVIFVSTDRGDGTSENPHRSVCQYWSKDGRLLADSDSLFDCPEAASYMAAERLLQVRADALEQAVARQTGDVPADIAGAGPTVTFNFIGSNRSAVINLAQPPLPNAVEAEKSLSECLAVSAQEGLIRSEAAAP